LVEHDPELRERARHTHSSFTHGRLSEPDHLEERGTSRTANLDGYGCRFETDQRARVDRTQAQRLVYHRTDGIRLVHVTRKLHVACRNVGPQRPSAFLSRARWRAMAMA